MTSTRDPTFTSTKFVDPTPAPSDLPAVDEVGLTSAPLKSASYFIGAYCKDYNEDFMSCKNEDNNPEHCLKEGRRVTRCALDLIQKLRENCDKEFEAHWKCLDKNNQELFYCRKPERAFNKCVFDKLVIARLCRSVVYEQFGDVAEAVVRILCRQTRTNLAQILKETKLTRQQVREALVVMMQHNLIKYSLSQEGQRMATYYEVDEYEICMRLRFGSFIYWAGEWFGPDERFIIEFILLYGRATPEMIYDYVINKGKQGKVTKAAAKKHSERRKQVEQTLLRLVNMRFVVGTRPTDAYSKIQKRLEAEYREEAKLNMPATATDKTKIKTVIEEEEERDMASSENYGLKRKATDDIDSAPLKRHAGADAFDNIEIDPAATFRVNYDRFNMRFRAATIEELVSERINRPAAVVMKRFLELTDHKVKETKDPQSSVATSITISQAIRPDADLASGIALRRDDMDDEEGPSKQQLTQMFLEIMTKDQIGFVAKKDDRGHGEYVIQFAKIRDELKKRVFFEVLQEQFGSLSVRLVRILMEKGKLDEKMIQKIAMIPQKDTREKLFLLEKAGFVHFQEVPKTADRAPSRTYYLFWVDLDTSYLALTNYIYKSMTNVRQRKQHERHLRQQIIEKTERKDVQENQELLGAYNQKEYAELQQMLSKLEVAEARISQRNGSEADATTGDAAENAAKFSEATPTLPLPDIDQTPNQLLRSKLDLEPNPFEQSFGGLSSAGTGESITVGTPVNTSGIRDTAAGPKDSPKPPVLPPVASIASPAILSQRNDSSTPLGWDSLRAGPLSPSMLQGPQHQVDYNNLRRLNGYRAEFMNGVLAPNAVYSQAPTVSQPPASQNNLYLLSQEVMRRTAGGDLGIKSEREGSFSNLPVSQSSSESGSKSKASISPLPTTRTSSRRRANTEREQENNDQPSNKKSKPSSNTNEKDPKDMDDEEKRKNFLERNRQAALKCRQRKKQWLANLQSKVEYLTNDNEQLQHQASSLREEIINLKTLLLAHKDCPIAQANGVMGLDAIGAAPTHPMPNRMGMPQIPPNQQMPVNMGMPPGVGVGPGMNGMMRFG
ncbi:hypothetical protein BZG36_02143 [Bifiguratus adelaidae]|uniref:DNA-directed RNA polymerase III subunit RPC3 n=1 Tax=Bifiguratus adelaidae TaxID=1938954 RepID=A0A261Y3H1_9FUNG|nr:hypothetical protein BZG36_02143 [Bifiguratus adelaidae]